MRVKRQKTNRKLMQMYCTSFGFREPYQLVVDGTLVNVALQHRNDLRTTIPSVLSAEIKLFSTPCVVQELQGMGVDFQGAVIAARRFEMRKCGHAPGTHTATQCIKDQVGTTNPHHLMIATQDKTLRKDLREVPGVPLMYISSSVLVLEPHSPQTIAKAKLMETQKTHALSQELEAINKRHALETDSTQTTTRPPMPKRRKVKGPNPLSVKKKKSKPAEQSTPKPPSGQRKRKSKLASSNSINTDNKSTPIQ